MGPMGFLLVMIKGDMHRQKKCCRSNNFNDRSSDKPESEGKGNVGPMSIGNRLHPGGINNRISEIFGSKN